MTIQELINHLKNEVDDKNLSGDTPVLFAQASPNNNEPDFYSEMYGYIQDSAFDQNTGTVHPKAYII